MSNPSTRLRRIYAGMKQRCYDSRKPEYKWYGEKGVKICNDWLSNFDSFESWAMSVGYADDLTIDRIDSSGDYCPGNCRWVTRSMNSSMPRGIENGKRPRYTWRPEGDLLERLHEIAKRNLRSVNSEIQIAVQKHIEEEQEGKVAS